MPEMHWQDIYHIQHKPCLLHNTGNCLLILLSLSIMLKAIYLHTNNDSFCKHNCVRIYPCMKTVKAAPVQLCWSFVPALTSSEVALLAAKIIFNPLCLANRDRRQVRLTERGMQYLFANCKETRWFQHFLLISSVHSP